MFCQITVLRLVSDSLTGGAGADVFIIGPEDGTDIVWDFDSTDTIYLTGSELAELAIYYEYGISRQFSLQDTSTAGAPKSVSIRYGPNRHGTEINIVDENGDRVSVTPIIAAEAGGRLEGTVGFDYFVGGAGVDEFVIRGVETATRPDIIQGYGVTDKLLLDLVNVTQANKKQLLFNDKKTTSLLEQHELVWRLEKSATDNPQNSALIDDFVISRYVERGTEPVLIIEDYVPGSLEII